MTASGAASILRLAGGTVLNQKHAARTLGLPMGCLLTPVPSEPHQLPVSQLPPAACNKCGAILNLHCKTDLRTGSWQCCFCKSSNRDPRPLHDTEACPQLAAEDVDYHIGDQHALESGPVQDRLAVVVDVTPDADILQQLRDLLLQVVAGLPSSTHVALIAFAAGVHVYDLGQALPVSAVTLPGHSRLSPQLLEHLRSNSGAHIQPLQACRPALLNSIHSLECAHRAAARGTRDRPRCLGAALETSLHLLNGWQSSGTGPHAATPAPGAAMPEQQTMSRAAAPCFKHVLLITGGPCSKGPGFVPFSVLDGTPHARDSHLRQQADQFFTAASQMACNAGIAVDVLAVGNLAVNAPLLSRLCDASGGNITLHEEFGPMVGTSISSALQRRVGLHGIMEMSLSGGLGVVRVTGPSCVVDRGPHGLIMRMRGHGWRGRLSEHARELRSVCVGQSFAIALEVLRPLEEPQAFIQVVVGWTARDGSQVQRVVTRQMRTTTVLSTHTQSLDVRLTALLLAKGIVGRAQELQAASDAPVRASLRQAVAKHICHIAEQVGQKLAAQKTWYGRKTTFWTLPVELHFLAEALYQLQRGHMLGKAACHADERAFLHKMFIAAPVDVALAMLAPQLYLHDLSTGFAPVLAADVTLTPESVGLLDNGTHIFIWLGHAIASAHAATAAGGTHGWTRAMAHEAAQREVARLMTHRHFPIPEVRVATQHTGSARLVTSRVIPVSQDAPEEQAAQWQDAAVLHSAEDGALLHVPNTEEQSLLQWCRDAGVELLRTNLAKPKR